MRKQLSTAKRYQVADSMSPAFRRLATVERRSAFGVVINAPIKINGKSTSLKQEFSDDIACHITNLVLRRVQGTAPIEVQF